MSYSPRVVLFSTILSCALIGCFAETETGQTMRGDNSMSSDSTATFAGGCFWCMEKPFEIMDGVSAVISGYAGGESANPTYQEVSSGKSGHIEVVQVHYDQSKISYRELLEIFWRQIDPTDDGGSFVDRGSQYSSAIFYENDEQKKIAEASRQALDNSGKFDKPVVTEIRPLEAFYPAENYHQDYYKTNPGHYKMYRMGSGRDQFIEKHWKNDTTDILPESSLETEQSSQSTEKEKAMSDFSNWEKPGDSALKANLTDLQYQVTQKDGTERAFSNEYWDNKESGIYVDIVSGEPLFASVHKYKSGTGWPSFYQPLEPENIVEKVDKSHFMVRTEVRSKHADSHLGHLFDDGPAPTGMRYCINSAALRFIPEKKLESEGYGQYAHLFE